MVLDRYPVGEDLNLLGQVASAARVLELHSKEYGEIG